MKEVTGNLQVKNGKYYVLVNLYDRSGKRSIKWVALGLDARGNKKAAKARMAEVLEEYNRSQRKLLRTISKKKAPEKFIQQREQVQYQTLTEFLTDWINLSSGRLQPSTIDGYMKMVNGRITEFFGNSGITIGDLAGEDLNDFYAYLEDSGLSGASALRYHGLIHAAFSYAVKKELLDDNPCDHADHPKRERYRASFYSEDELRDLLIAARESPIYIPVMLAAYYGLRRSEALGLKWSNIDFQSKTISISHKVIEANVDGKYQAKGLKNGIPMKAIQEWLGHSTFEVTANIYAHLDYSSKESSAAKMAQLLAISE